VADNEATFQWIKQGPVKTVNIELSGNGISGPWEVVTDSIDASLGVYTCTVSAPVSPTCYARITSSDNSAVSDISDAPFKIAKKMLWYRSPGLEETSPLFWLFLNMTSPFMATMFSLIGFFIASAAFRAFRARSLEATLLLITALIIMLGQTPLGGMIWSGIPDIMVWIFNVPSMAARRAISFGITMGTIAFSLRIILGIERAYLGGGKD